jgi:hypothetical protein
MNYEKRKCDCCVFILFPSNLHPFGFAGFPLASVVLHPATQTQGPTAILKTRCEASNKDELGRFASGNWTAR